MFGSEQAALQVRVPLRFIYRLIGEYRYPLRLRNFYLKKNLPKDFIPVNIWDAGCGGGHTTFFLAHHYPNATVIGTDINSNIVEQCKTILSREQTSNISFDICDAAEANLESTFDLIVCFEVLEHIDDYKKAIQKLSAALRPGGYLILHTPAAGKFQSSEFGLRRFAKLVHASPTLEKGQYHVREGFQDVELEDCFIKNGLILEIRRTFGPLAMFAHTIYERTRSRTLSMIITFPFLMGMGILDWYLPKREGGGLLVCAQKKRS